MNKEKMLQGMSLFLEGLGVDLDNEHLVETPERIVRAWTESFAKGYKEDPVKHLEKTFTDEYDSMIVIKDIPFVSTCAHHLVPFYGKAKIGYIPNGIITGLSKLVRVLEGYARRLQIQERLTEQVAYAIDKTLEPKGVGVILEAEHMCMTIRGISKPGAKTVTSCLLGVMREDSSCRDEFLRF